VACKLLSLTSVSRSLMNLDLIIKSPVDAIDTPRPERKTLTYLTPEV
jgi:hypothetical protein